MGKKVTPTPDNQSIQQTGKKGKPSNTSRVSPDQSNRTASSMNRSTTPSNLIVIDGLASSIRPSRHVRLPAIDTSDLSNSAQNIGNAVVSTAQNVPINGILENVSTLGTNTTNTTASSLSNVGQRSSFMSLETVRAVGLGIAFPFRFGLACMGINTFSS